MRRTTVLALLVALVLPNAALAAPRERDSIVVSWIAERLEPVIALFAPDSVGPGADPDGLTDPPPPPPPPEDEEVGPGADPDG